MTASNEELELKDRLRLIETMIAEGRRTTESYGWTFFLWGVAYYIAILWAGLGHSYLAWPVTMTAAGVLTVVIITRKRSKRPPTTTARAIGAIWCATGISMFVLFMALGWSGKLMDYNIFVAIMAAMLATVNAASSMILRWKLQFACALVWWALTVYACFGKGKPLTIAFLAALFFCQIVFGVYGMIREASARRKAANHA
jgi:hypothetical protein